MHGLNVKLIGVSCSPYTTADRAFFCYLQVLRLALVGGAVGPLSVADDPLVTVGEVQDVRGVEDVVGDGEEHPHYPDGAGDAERGSLAHARLQRVEDGHVPARVVRKSILLFFVGTFNKVFIIRQKHFLME